MAEITVNHWNNRTEELGVCTSGELVEVSVRYESRPSVWTTITYADAHKVADWIKENIPEPPPAPPEWRIATGDGEATLMIDDYQAVWLNKTGEFCGDSTASFSLGRITPELHKEMICALLDAHYELNKGES